MYVFSFRSRAAIFRLAVFGAALVAAAGLFAQDYGGSPQAAGTEQNGLEATPAAQPEAPAGGEASGTSAAGQAGAAQAAAQKPQPPAYRDLRYDEDWSPLRDSTGAGDYFDRLKYIRLDDKGSFASIGGEIRYRGDYWRNANFGFMPPGIGPDLGAFFQRYMIHSDVHIGRHLRFFAQFASTLEDGKKGGPWPSDRDVAEVHQAFLEIGTSEGSAGRIAVRLGRQELAFGQSHFISPADFYNTPRTFDGIRIQAFKGPLEFNAFVVKPVEQNTGAFDDSPNHAQTFAAASIFAPNPLTKNGRVALFFINLDTKAWYWQAGYGRDDRRTLGARILGQQKSVDYVYELLLQWGTFQGWLPIHAWGITTDTGYSVYKWRYYPRFGLRVNATSGNHHPGALGTFNPMFPDNAYSGKIGLIGPSNSIDVTPNLRFIFPHNVFFIPDCAFFWRQSSRDGIYGVFSPYLVLPSSGSPHRYIGTQVSLPVQINVSRHFTYTIALSHLFAGAFLKDLKPTLGQNGQSVTFLTNFLTYRF